MVKSREKFHQRFGEEAPGNFSSCTQLPICLSYGFHQATVWKNSKEIAPASTAFASMISGEYVSNGVTGMLIK